MDTLRQDVVYALRRLVQAPGFAAVAIMTLALGIGANSAIFSITHAVLLKALPFEKPERLVRLSQTWEHRSVGVYSPQNFLDTEAQARSFESLAAVDGGSMTLTDRGAPALIQSAGVSATFFHLLGIRPVLGRAFETGENDPGRSRIVVLGHALWRTRFAADPSVVGQTIHLDREDYLVVGVAPAGFAFPEKTEAWTPVPYDDLFRTKSRGAWYLTVIGRLKPGVTLAAANEEVGAIAERLAKAYPDADKGVGGAVASLHEAMVGDTRPALLVLLGAVALVLLIACVNVANLLLARVSSREPEIALRQALGAGRPRLVRQLMTESLLLAGLGGGAGLLLARFSLEFLIGLQPAGVPRLADVGVDRVVVAFAAALSLLTAVLFGAFPALHATGRAAVQALREGGRGLSSGRGARLRGGLVVGQMALAMMLLAGAGLLIRSFARLHEVNPGFRPENALTFRLSLPESAYATEGRRAAFFQELLPRLRALPGVRSAAAVVKLPISGSNLSISFEVKGRPPLPPADQPSMEMRVATAGYFETMGIPMRRGRAFDRGDTADSPQVVVLSETAVRRYFPSEDPMGKWITLGWGRSAGLPPPGGEVVGVVGDVKDRGLAQENPPEVYLPHAQLPLDTMSVVLRTAVPPLSLAPVVEKAVHEMDPELPVARLSTLEDIVSRSVSEARFYMVLLGAFAAMALALAALGIFGVMSYAVVQRSREIGIRIALGADPRGVRRMVLGQALRLTVSGVTVGLVASLALSRTLAGLLFDLSPTDPATMACVAVVLSGVATLASYLPARTATRVDPLTALRSE